MVIVCNQSVPTDTELMITFTQLGQGVESVAPYRRRTYTVSTREVHIFNLRDASYFIVFTQLLVLFCPLPFDKHIFLGVMI